MQALRELLEIWGHSVGVARDGRKGLEAVRECLPDVVRFDLGLPPMDGYEVARRLKSEAATASVKIIALTGRKQVEARQMAQESGFDACLVKAADPDERYATLERLRDRS